MALAPETSQTERWERLKRGCLIAIGFVFLLGILNACFRPFEPRYDGQPLSYWLARVGEGGSQNFLRKNDEALRAIGTNAVPWLRRELRSRDIPVLDPLFGKASERWQYFGPVFQTGAKKRANAAYTARTITGPAQELAPDLIACIEDPDPFVRRSVVMVLGDLRASAESAVPALTKALRDPDALVAQLALQSLGDFGTNAVSALSAASAMTNHPSEYVRRAAVRNMSRISGTPVQLGQPTVKTPE